jgi:hypothetical protein
VRVFDSGARPAAGRGRSGGRRPAPAVVRAGAVPVRGGRDAAGMGAGYRAVVRVRLDEDDRVRLVPGVLRAGSSVLGFRFRTGVERWVEFAAVVDALGPEAGGAVRMELTFPDEGPGGTRGPGRSSRCGRTDPDDAAVAVRLVVGSSDGPGEESFDVLVCAPARSARSAAGRGPPVAEGPRSTGPAGWGGGRRRCRVNTWLQRWCVRPGRTVEGKTWGGRAG